MKTIVEELITRYVIWEQYFLCTTLFKFQSTLMILVPYAITF